MHGIPPAISELAEVFLCMADSLEHLTILELLTLRTVWVRGPLGVDLTSTAWTSPLLQVGQPSKRKGPL